MQRACVAELIGTALLLAAVVGSGIMGERLAEGNAAIALLANTVATGAALVALIATFGPISGAHFNPCVSCSATAQGELSWRGAGAYVVAQILGAFAGVALAHAMFAEPLYAWSAHERSGGPQMLSEGVATFGLLGVVIICPRQKPNLTPFAVGAYIVAAYWFTASTSFANPAVTLARAATNTFAGIRLLDVPGFIVAQIVGASLATVLFRWLLSAGADVAADAVTDVFGKESHHVSRAVQRPISLHGQLGPEHHGRSSAEPLGEGAVSRLQRRQPPQG